MPVPPVAVIVVAAAVVVVVAVGGADADADNDEEDDEDGGTCADECDGACVEDGGGNGAVNEKVAEVGRLRGRPFAGRCCWCCCSSVVVD